MRKKNPVKINTELDKEIFVTSDDGSEYMNDHITAMFVKEKYYSRYSHGELKEKSGTSYMLRCEDEMGVVLKHLDRLWVHGVEYSKPDTVGHVLKELSLGDKIIFKANNIVSDDDGRTSLPRDSSIIDFIKHKPNESI